MTSNGTRQLKLIRFGSFLNRDSHFRCLLWVKNVEKLTATTRNQDPVHNETYFSKEFSGLKDGSWQTLEFAFNELSFKDKPENKVQNNWFLGNIYLQVTPASDKNPKDVEFMIADTICWDGILKNDPLTDPDAPEKALAEDPIWNAQKPEK